jgi:hypothetical protein
MSQLLSDLNQSLASSAINDFLSGATMMAFLVAALFFLRFWKKTRDRFFVMFALAFFVLALNRFALLFVQPMQEVSTLWIYMIRLAAFIIILIAIVDKNRAATLPSK